MNGMQCVESGKFAAARDGKPISHGSRWSRGYDGQVVTAELFDGKKGRVLVRPEGKRSWEAKAYWVGLIQFNNGNRSYQGPQPEVPSGVARPGEPT